MPTDLTCAQHLVQLVSRRYFFLLRRRFPFRKLSSGGAWSEFILL
jgi:hypothetical protein